jgi:2'-5' RNA ligase
MTYSNAESSHRIFIGIPVGSRAQKSIERALKPLQMHSRNLRWVPAGNLHMTLAFLGDISAGELEAVKTGFAGAYATNRQLKFQLSALGRFPNSRGHIIALTGAVNEPLLALAMATRDMLSRCGLDFERKKFRPHITLARVRNPRHPVVNIDQQVNIDMDIKRVVLYRSTLTGSGSIHTPLVNTDLR